MATYEVCWLHAVISIPGISLWYILLAINVFYTNARWAHSEDVWRRSLSVRIVLQLEYTWLPCHGLRAWSRCQLVARTCLLFVYLRTACSEWTSWQTVLGFFAWQMDKERWVSQQTRALDISISLDALPTSSPAPLSYLSPSNLLSVVTSPIILVQFGKTSSSKAR